MEMHSISTELGILSACSECILIMQAAKVCGEHVITQKDEELGRNFLSTKTALFFFTPVVVSTRSTEASVNDLLHCRVITVCLT